VYPVSTGRGEFSFIMPICTESFSRIIPPGSDWHHNNQIARYTAPEPVLRNGLFYAKNTRYGDRAGMTKISVQMSIYYDCLTGLRHRNHKHPSLNRSTGLHIYAAFLLAMGDFYV
ncbi:hypothetical protein DN195_27870, partial [Salmonella enterica subsp. enterica serovar Panama]|nr:hypothetical protein [Salmonella enterica subsp. enterica serovar Panama]EBW9463742.1 hypothetical protein [Salmonella enterica subsp. enterica serovar Panama]